eukprot:5401876-Amphidinium_carterae.1
MLKNTKNLDTVSLRNNLVAMSQTLRSTLPDGMFDRWSNYIIQRYLKVFDSDDKHNIDVIRNLRQNLKYLEYNSLVSPVELHIYADEAKAAAEREGGGTVRIETAVKAFLSSQLTLLKDAFKNDEHLALLGS